MQKAGLSTVFGALINVRSQRFLLLCTPRFLKGARVKDDD